MDKQKILITGSNSGLGRHLTKRFRSAGHEIMDHRGRKDCDLRNYNEIKRLAQLAKDFGVTTLINNAVIKCPSIPLWDYSEDLIKDMIKVNLEAPILLTYYLMPTLSNIINVNSMVGLEVKQNRTLYSATKWGLRGFSNSLKEETNNVNILDVYPTNIRTYPGKKDSMDVDEVVEKIYSAFVNKEKKIILDGRLK